MRILRRVHFTRIPGTSADRLRGSVGSVAKIYNHKSHEGPRRKPKQRPSWTFVSLVVEGYRFHFQTEPLPYEGADNSGRWEVV
jgi:hypothetical protein